MENENIFSSRIDLHVLRENVVQIKQEIAKVLVGQEETVELLLTALFADGHVLIEGVPGVAKTLTAKIIAKIVSAQFARIQFTPDLMPSDILGTNIFNLKINDFEYKKGAIFTNILLIDEINRAPAKTQSALFELMEERQVTMDGKTYPMDNPFVVLATQNPIEQEGTYRLPEAQLDRFLFKIEIKYPSLLEEVQILQKIHQQDYKKLLTQIEPLLSKEKLLLYRSFLQNVTVENRIIEYIAKIIVATRNNSSIYLGASPRASIALLNGSKAYALLQGRDFITPDDVKRISFPVLRHRLQLTPEREMEGINTDHVVREILQKIEVPR
ncbi:MAG: MoxR family ATPase [Flammeovirgaceae bacterium]|nr:MoxR family ATPase [Flammeovirgaceae bacterium]MDW8286866.1 MoxR family ATPase [Flammeovirgaceae bacterium]